MASRIVLNVSTGEIEIENLTPDEETAHFVGLVEPPAPDETPVSARDERLLAAVDAAKTAVTASKSFTSEQAAVLSAVFDGLGKAITGEAP